jgi:hypothetical protein
MRTRASTAVDLVRDTRPRIRENAQSRGTSRVKGKDLHPWMSVIASGESRVSHAGVSLIETARCVAWR